MEKPFTTGILREITDQYEAGDISYSKMAEMLNDISIRWHEGLSKYNPMTDGTPYPFASGPVDNGYKLPINPTISKMETTQTAVEWLYNNLKSHFEHDGDLLEVVQMSFEQAKQMEKEQRIKDYNAGYTDAQCNHINDAENYANEIEYLKSKIDNIDDEIKRREEKIVSLLINGNTDPDIKDYIISPFGTPEKK